MAGDLTPDAWRDFHDNVLKQVGGLRELVTDSDKHKPGCNDAPADAGPGNPTIVSRFWADSPLAELRPFVDPRNWQRLGAQFWKEMTAIEGPVFTTDGYSAVFREVVLLPTGPITVYLDVTFREDEHSSLTTYLEARGRDNEYVTKDRGYVFATDRTVPPMPAQTLVYSTKTIVFADPALNTFTDLACDNGWVELMINMALPAGRRAQLAPRDPAAESAGAASAPASELDGWADAAQHLVSRYVTVTNTSVDALRQGRCDAELVDDILSIGDDITDTATKGARAFREYVGKLADLGDRP
jgi:hypothetical protein